MAAANRLATTNRNGHATAEVQPTERPVATERPAATEGQDVAELRHRAASAACDVEYALKQLRQYRDIGRAVDALERVEEALNGLK